MDATNPPQKLTARQLRFIDEYMIDSNGAAAAVRAGYSPKTAREMASENLSKPHISAVLRKRQAQASEELNITREGVIKGLLDAFELAKSERNPASMVSAMATVAKMLGFYSPEVKKVELDVQGRVGMGRMNALSDAELLRIIGAGRDA
jgi:phage terminase small subunit